MYDLCHRIEGIFPLSRGSQLQLQAMPQQKGHREASLCLTCPEAAMVLDEDGFILFICLKLFECCFLKKNTMDHIFVYSYMVHDMYVCLFLHLLWIHT